MLHILGLLFLVKNVHAQWEACASGAIALTINGSETEYVLKNDSSVIPLPPGIQCTFQIQPLPLTVMYIYVTGTNFTNFTVIAYFEGNMANPIYIADSNPIEYALPPSATPYLIVVRRQPNEPPATFAMKIRGERITPGEVVYTLGSNSTLRVALSDITEVTMTFLATGNYRVGILVDCHSNSTNMTAMEAINLLRNQIFFTNTSYLTTAAAIFQNRNGVYPSGQQYLTMYNKMNATDKVNLIAFAYKETSNILWNSYSFADWSREELVLNTVGGTFGAKIIAMMGDTTKGTLEDVNWGSANQLDIYEGIAEVNVTTTTGKLITSLNRTTTISANNTIKLPSSLYTFVNRGGSMDILLGTTTGTEGKGVSMAIQLNLILFLMILTTML